LGPNFIFINAAGRIITNNGLITALYLNLGTYTYVSPFLGNAQCHL